MGLHLPSQLPALWVVLLLSGHISRFQYRLDRKAATPYHQIH